MIRTGKYSALEKWEILLQHWNDPAADPRAGRYGAACLPDWEQAARTGGNAALVKHASIAPDRPVRIDPGWDAETLAAFREGALQSLRFTVDDSEVPGLDELRFAARSRNFPVDAIGHKERALCLFCALFYGRADVIHIHEAAPRDVTLVDSDERVGEMRLIYPQHWRYVQSDWNAYLDEALSAGATYDLVTADQPAHLAPDVLWQRLPDFMRLSTDTFIANYFPENLAELGVDAYDLVGLQRAVAAKTGVDVLFAQMLKRGPGLYWAVMRKL